MNTDKRTFIRSICVAMMLVALPEIAFAALPWENVLCQVSTSLSGPVASGAAIIALVVTGALIAFGETSGIFGAMMRVLFGLSVALLAGQWLNLFGAGSSACIG